MQNYEDGNFFPNVHDRRIWCLRIVTNLVMFSCCYDRLLIFLWHCRPMDGERVPDCDVGVEKMAELSIYFNQGRCEKKMNSYSTWSVGENIIQDHLWTYNIRIFAVFVKMFVFQFQNNYFVLQKKCLNHSMLHLQSLLYLCSHVWNPAGFLCLGHYVEYYLLQ